VSEHQLRVYDIPEHHLREVRVKLPRDIAEWLEDIARARGETVSEVLAWTLGNLMNFYDRWYYAWKKRCKQKHE
jgi:anthranilate phosphoribosyltransferase